MERQKSYKMSCSMCALVDEHVPEQFAFASVGCGSPIVHCHCERLHNHMNS